MTSLPAVNMHRRTLIGQHNLVAGHEGMDMSTAHLS